MSVIRLRSADTGRLVELADIILTKWRGYTDEESFIFAETDGEPHNTITPIARKKDGIFELDLVLRNNITTPEHPLGVYHPHEKLHHIKRENIGLIEVMGLAVLPARLANEIKALGDALVNKTDLSGDEKLSGHAQWMNELYAKYPAVNADDAENIIKREIGAVFEQVLLDAGVYKRNDEGKAAFLRFIDSVK